MNIEEIPSPIDKRDKKYPSFKIWLFGGCWDFKYGKGCAVAPPLHKRIWTKYTWSLRMKIKNYFNKNKRVDNDNSELMEGSK